MTDVHAARPARRLAEQAITLPAGERVGLHVHFHTRESLPAHPNGLRFEGRWADDRQRGS